MTHRATSGFLRLYNALPDSIRENADKAFALLKLDPTHPSLRFKKLHTYWSVRIGLHYRALASQVTDGYVWFWIGSHAEYDSLVK